MVKSLLEIHEDVPANHYDKGIKRNLFQKYWHNRRFGEVKKLVFETQEKVLDVGCHGGTFTKVLIDKTNCKNIYGVDISKSAIDLAQKRIPFGKFLVADASKLPFKDKTFGVVYCLEALEHIDEPLKAIQEIHRVLKNKGKAIFLVPTDNKLFKIVWFLWTWYYPVWRHAHVNSFSGNTLEGVLKKLKFKVLETKVFNLGMLKVVVALK